MEAAKLNLFFTKRFKIYTFAYLSCTIVIKNTYFHKLTYFFNYSDRSETHARMCANAYTLYIYYFTLLHFEFKYGESKLVSSPYYIPDWEYTHLMDLYVLQLHMHQDINMLTRYLNLLTCQCINTNTTCRT